MKDGVIIAVGPLAEVIVHQGDGTSLSELERRALQPGFVDSHGHVVMGGLQALSANPLPPPDGPNTDIASLQSTFREWFEANHDVVERVDVIVGFGYDDSQLAEVRHPTRQELDAVSTEYPIIIVDQSGHFGVANS